MSAGARPARRMPSRPSSPSVVAEMTLRALMRRRGALALLLLLPLAFYLVRHGSPGQAVRFLGVGLAWAASTIALFATLAARAIEPRLRVARWSWRALLGGRTAAQLVVAITLALVYWLLVAIDHPVGRIGAVGLMLLVTACTGVAGGAALGAIARRELEGALLLFIVAGLQFTANPPTAFAHALPWWSTRELATYAVDGPHAGSLSNALLHAAITVLVCAGITVMLTAARLRDKTVSSATRRPSRPPRRARGRAGSAS